MSEPRCKTCGATLSSEGGSAVCPRCVLELALASRVGSESSERDAGADASSPGETIGPYTLVRKIGQGGMGDVWLARQTEPMRREVALKIIRRGLDTEHFVARFERERQALALMDHPAVARIYDAGTTDDGLPYLVMEYVPGEPINAHCTTHDLSLAERLELFGEVCRGVHHAHQKAIVHRDLKPTNVLVKREDGRSVPKIIDFGIAKALGKDLTERTLFTEVGVLVGTPEYMSPEQAAAGEGVLDTRSDVYSLGIMLYELITGVLPFDPRKLRAKGYDGIRRLIVETEPDKPSVRLDTLGELSRDVRGDLDWITMKALSKEPDRRYPSCAEFASDIERHLRQEPVIAGPPSATYRARKFVRRHRSAVFASAAVVALLVVGLVVTTALWREARAQRELAEARFDRVIQLSDLKRVRDYTEQAETLWPAHPDRLDALESWLSEKALPLAASLPRHREVLEGLRATALPYDDEQRERDRTTHPDAVLLAGHRAYVAEKTEEIPKIRANEELEDREDIAAHYELRVEQSRAEIARLEELVNQRRTWLFEDDRTQWLHDMLTELVAELEVFTDPDPFVGPIASVRERIELARTIEERSVGGAEVAAAWDEAVSAIASSPAYDGLRLAPQLGLVPLGEDPSSGLWEFWHVASGARPATNEDPTAASRWAMQEDTGLVLVLIPGGTFWMGAQADDPSARHYDPHAQQRESRVHEVELSAFFLSKYEMTQAQWMRLTGSNPSRHAVEPDVTEQLVDERNPVELVTWDDANDLLRKYALVLPTEAQWEYAARAGTTTPWWTGADERSLSGAANLCDLALKEYGGPKTWTYETWLDDGSILHAPVGSYRANAFGLHDMLGNVSEHCREFYQSPYRDSERPGDGFQEVPVGTRSRIHRGGSWMSTAETARVSRRGNLSLGTSLPDVGVRPARAIDP